MCAQAPRGLRSSRPFESELSCVVVFLKAGLLAIAHVRLGFRLPLLSIGVVVSMSSEGDSLSHEAACLVMSSGFEEQTVGGMLFPLDALTLKVAEVCMHGGGQLHQKLGSLRKRHRTIRSDPPSRLASSRARERPLGRSVPVPVCLLCRTARLNVTDDLWTVESNEQHRRHFQDFGSHA